MARDIKIAGKYPLTFSIGVGLGADSLSESEKIARQCLDMALVFHQDAVFLLRHRMYLKKFS